MQFRSCFQRSCIHAVGRLIDKDKEIERLTKETERLAKEIARCEGMLNNPNFVNKAPAARWMRRRISLQNTKK